MLLVLMLGVVLSGGRGGAVVVVVSTLVFSIRKYGYRSTVLKILVLGLIIIILISQLQGYDVYDRIMGGGGRLFSYISDSGLDLSQTSNRDLVWEHSLIHIKESWLFGFGPFSYEKVFGPGFYPHNLFLDFFIHGGLIYVLIWIIILLVFFIKLIGIVKRDLSTMIFLVPFLNSVIMLIFSATYLQEGLFWFSIFFIFSYNYKSITYINK
jgi:O-antigen ligase